MRFILLLPLLLGMNVLILLRDIYLLGRPYDGLFTHLLSIKFHSMISIVSTFYSFLS
jgi:hypothetical protein